MARKLVQVCVGIVALVLGSCGGGGGGGGSDLYAEFGYDAARVSVFSNVSITPQLNGLDGVSPHFEANSLPEGLSIDHGTGVVSGVPLAAWNGTIIVTLTVKGYRGSLTRDFLLEVDPVVTNYAEITAGIPGINVEAGLPAGPFPPTSLGFLVEGVTLQYSASAGQPLPPGMVIDAVSGAISGTPTAVGLTQSTLQVRASYLGHVVDGARSYYFQVRAPNVYLLYTDPSSAFSGAVGVPLTVSQATAGSGALDSDWLSDFYFDGTEDHGSINAIPPGLTLDPSTGAISGTPTAAGAYVPTIAATFHRGAYTQLVKETLHFLIAE